MIQSKTIFFIMVFISIVVFSLALTKAETAPTGNGVVCGYIRDVCDVPVNGTLIKIFSIESGISNTTITDSTGYYALELPSGYISLSVLDARYSNYGEFLNVSSDETKWFNITLYPLHNAKICGYVLNYTNGQPIDNAKIIVSVLDVTSGKLNPSNIGVTGFTGYFEIDTYASENTVIFIVASGYNETSITVSIPEGTYWYNTTLEPKEIVGEGAETEVPTSLKEVFVSNILIAQLLIAVVCLVAILIIGNFVLVRGKK